MNIWKKKRRKEKEEWLESIEQWKRKVYRCHVCRDTRRCQICQGAGCMNCDYVGRCQHCITDGER